MCTQLRLTKTNIGVMVSEMFKITIYYIFVDIFDKIKQNMLNYYFNNYLFFFL